MQRSEIINKISIWLKNYLHDEKIPNDVIALNFGIQRAYNQFEIYISGHDDFNNEHDTWLLSDVYHPKDNYFGLGISSLELTDKEIFELYKSEVQNHLDKMISTYPPTIKYFTCCFPIGRPELIKEI